jgi:iron-sulfur cluster assembly protein
MNITISPSAEKFMRRMVRFNGGAPGAGFRLKVSAGGCSGLSSEFTVEAAALPGDSALDWNGLIVFLPAESRLLLDGYTIDFSEAVQESGLVFRNASAPASSCGSHAGGSSCGSHAPGEAAAPAVAAVSISSIQRMR